MTGVASGRSARVDVWPPFVWAAIGLTLVAGFGLGGALFAAQPGPLGALGLIGSAVLEVAGLSLGLGLLLATARGGPSLAARAGFVQVLPFLVTAFVAFWLTLLANLMGLIAAVQSGSGVVPGLDGLAVLLALQGFLVPIAVAIGARTFPLHFASQQPRLPMLRVGLVCLLLGLVLRVVGEPVGVSLAASAGQLSTAAAYVLFVVGVRVFAPRRTVPGGRVAWFRDAAQWHALAAFGWLLLDALLLVVAAATGGLSLGADRHLLGAGFVTLLILGEGAKLLPGFTGQPLRSERLVWLTLGLGNAAAVLRVGPPLLPGLLNGPLAESALALSGLLGVLAIGVFALAAVVFRYTLWITRPPTWRYFKAGWANFLSWRNFLRYTSLIPKAWWTDIFGETFIWKRSRQRWLMHMAIFWGRAAVVRHHVSADLRLDSLHPGALDDETHMAIRPTRHRRRHDARLRDRGGPGPPLAGRG